MALRLMGDRSQRKKVLPLLEDPDGAVRLRAFEYLFAFDDPALMDRLVTVAGDPSPWIAPTAARQLAASDRADSAVAALLTRAAECPDHARAARYLTALGRFPSPTEWPLPSQERLGPFLEHEDERVRIRAAALVAALDPIAARRSLDQALTSDDAENRLEATRALAEVEGRAEPSTVAGLLADDDPEVRRAAVTLATALTPRQRRRAFLEVLERPGEPDEVLSLVLASFPEVGAEEDAELLMRYAREGGSDFLRMNAVTALARLERRTGTRLGDLWYRDVLGGGTEDEVIKRTVLTALQLTGDETYLPLLAAELKACSPESKAYAEALAKTISILVGRRLHGQSFGLEASP